MKNLRQYILEADEGEKKTTERGDIKFTIWEEPSKKVNWLENNLKFQKIEYKHVDKKKHIEIDFILGYQDETWKLWIGKIGSLSYDDDPYYNFNTDDFSKAIVAALDKVEEFVQEVEENPDNWVQYYKDV